MKVVAYNQTLTHKALCSIVTRVNAAKARGVESHNATFALMNAKYSNMCIYSIDILEDPAGLDLVAWVAVMVCERTNTLSSELREGRQLPGSCHSGEACYC